MEPRKAEVPAPPLPVYTEYSYIKKNIQVFFSVVLDGIVDLGTDGAKGTYKYIYYIMFMFATFLTYLFI